MNKILLCLIATMFGTAGIVSVTGQEVAGLAASPVIIAPPQTPLARTIKAGLSAAYYGSTKQGAAYSEAQRLYFFYGSRHFEPIWLDTAANGDVQFSEPALKILQLFEAAASQ